MIVTQLWSFLNHEILTLFLPQLCLCTSVLCVMMKNIFVWFPYYNHNIKSHKGGNEGIISGLEQEKERETNVCWLDEEAIMCGKCIYTFNMNQIVSRHRKSIDRNYSTCLPTPAPASPTPTIRKTHYLSNIKYLWFILSLIHSQT